MFNFYKSAPVPNIWQEELWNIKSENDTLKSLLSDIKFSLDHFADISNGTAKNEDLPKLAQRSVNVAVSRARAVEVLVNTLIDNDITIPDLCGPTVKKTVNIESSPSPSCNCPKDYLCEKCMASKLWA